MTISELRKPECLFFEAITGSRAYGTDTPESDTDIKGVFVQPKASWFGLEHFKQINNETNDEAYYELGRFVELLLKNNPGALELLASPEDCVRFRHPLMAMLPLSLFLSKLCFDAFAGYAVTQLEKARGLNKKIVNPLPKEKRGVLDFCYVLQGQGAVGAREWLAQRGWQGKDCGLVNVPHVPNLYGLYHDVTQQLGFRGIVRDAESHDVSLSSIPKGLEPVGWLSFNTDAYKQYCRHYAEYWQWVEKRNEARFQSTMSHGQGYDAKNLMHTFRLLDQAREIATSGTLTVRTRHRELLLKIKQGGFTYEELVLRAENEVEEIRQLFQASDLPEKPDQHLGELRLRELRAAFYGVYGD